ncbi:transglutaminase [Salipaludibacillus neizhouensis]|uniref:Transglutaminase n=1 Tax=Salipaludibacillus neizhouensis TaxID=885475 RepID=A0A3A9KE22_9BACI|nr:transglutaminase-like domain-containing protein [Salipaludibacillus neizhouensis]RKL67883.1 transglutaminase [Salipaludibacillus neizhouensis]
MTQTRKLVVFICTFTFLLMAGCSEPEEETSVTVDTGEETENQEETKKFEDDVIEEPVPESMELSDYADEIGFMLDSPKKEKFEVNTTFEVQGSIEEIKKLVSDDIWITLTRNNGVRDLETDDFNYYLPLEGGKFKQTLSLFHGKGEYEVRVRAPSNKSGEEDRYYDVAVFDVVNRDDKIQREIEYTQFGKQHGISLISPKLGLKDREESVYIEGTVPEDHHGKMVLVQVEKDEEKRQLVFAIHGDRFAGDVPLYFGKGIHQIRVQTIADGEEYYYDSATFYADNQSTTEMAKMEKFNQYINRGVTVYEPSWSEPALQEKLKYRVRGKIDSEVAGADDISHMIVTVNKLDEDKSVANYFVPVEDYIFDDDVYFRFGPGRYEVVINVPDLDQRNQSVFYYQGVMRTEHEVMNIEDKRDLLPSRGIESDHPKIIDKAKEVTAGLESDREKAKAVYQFVAKHVAYDVEKAEQDLFNLDDSALSTLDSGSGVCQDYAFLATALLRAIGIESHYVEGYTGERHAWVEVKVDGEWMEMDPTWGAGYVQNRKFVFQYNEDYFDPDQAFLDKTHRREGIMY